MQTGRKENRISGSWLFTDAALRANTSGKSPTAARTVPGDDRIRASYPMPLSRLQSVRDSYNFSEYLYFCTVVLSDFIIAGTFLRSTSTINVALKGMKFNFKTFFNYIFFTFFITL